MLSYLWAENFHKTFYIVKKRPYLFVNYLELNSRSDVVWAESFSGVTYILLDFQRMLARLPGAHNFSFYHAMVFQKGGAFFSSQSDDRVFGFSGKAAFAYCYVVTSSPTSFGSYIIHHHTPPHLCESDVCMRCTIHRWRRHCLLAPSFHKFKHNPIFWALS